MEVRIAKIEDVPEMIRLWEIMQTAHLGYDLRFYALTDRRHYIAAATSYISALVDDPAAVCVVCLDGERIVGSLVAKIEKKPPVYTGVTVASIDHVVVDETFRRRGVFRMLFARLEAEAKARGVDSIECFVDCDNQAASAYRAVGMVSRQLRMVKHMKDSPNHAPANGCGRLSR